MGFLFKMVGFCCGILVILFSYAEVTEPDCQQCGCCINKECSTQYADGRYIDGYCTRGCIVGYGGHKCYNKCANDCVTCNQTVAQNCATCDERKYVNEEGRCVNCPKNCKQCTAATQCQECYFPYSNPVSKQDCSLTCPRNCMCETLGVCSSCKDGFFNVGNTCQDACLINCKTCTDQSHCQSCESSYSGDKCCVKDGHCLKCSSSTECETCSNGYYGDQCGKICPTKCKGSHCNRENGNCISCQDGYHGTKCGMLCPKTCHRLLCDINTGNCISCQDGYHGTKCGMSCPKTCHRLQCDINTGNCLSCQDGYHGTKCGKPCPNKCHQRQCDINTGICLSCDVGLYGNSCTLNCSKRCLNNHCNKANGQCSDGCVAGYKGPNCTEVSTTDPNDKKGSNNIGGTVGGVVGGISAVVVVAVVIIVIVRRRRSGTSGQKDKEDIMQEDFKLPVIDHDGLEVDEDDHAEFIPNETDKQESVYENLPGVPVSRLEETVRSKKKEDFQNEFGKLPKGLTQSYNDSKKPENVEMNRYRGMYPYDHSRVKLKSDPDFFINACYIDGYKKPNGYIASLGPIAKATKKYYTFWKMVWHKKADIVVMLTNLIEPSGNKCEQYWPDLNSTNTHNDYTVSCQKIDEFAEYTLRTFTIEKNSEKRTVYQLHYTAWPDKSIPDEVTSLVEFRQRVRSIPRAHQGPVIVHCSAGIGRTGTYIALDRLTEAGEAGERINVYDCVFQMRQQRLNMVQTLEQYEFLHKTLVHTLTFGGAAIRAEEFGEYVRNTSDDEFKKNYTLSNDVIDEESVEEVQARATNGRHRDKNRKKSDIPGDRHRPMLYLGRSFNAPNYINAMNVNGFKRKNQFIIAQSPLKDTVEDFLCLIYQENCCCVVSLEDEHLIGKEIGAYLGTDNQELKHGNFTVKSELCESKETFTIKKLTIKNKDKHSAGEKVVHHYQLNSWKKKDVVPSDAKEFTQFVKEVCNKADESDTERAPILVHCLNGAYRSGLFCAVSNVLEKINFEGQVSVPNTVRQLRTRRKMAIPNKEQFEFCYHSVVAYLDSNNTYCNFSN